MKRTVFTLITILLPLILIGQGKTERIYFDSEWEKCDSSIAKFISTYYYTDAVSNQGKIITTDNTGQKISEYEYSDMKTKAKEGTCSDYYATGILRSKVSYRNGKYHDELTNYYPSGQLKRRETYNNGEMVSGNCYTATGQDTTYFSFEVQPVYPGGNSELIKFLKSNIVYLKKCRKNNITGKVFLKFIVGSDGVVRDIRILKGVHPLIDEEAIRVMKLMGKWTPGMQDGKKVSVQFNLPINFTLK